MKKIVAGFGVFAAGFAVAVLAPAILRGAADGGPDPALVEKVRAYLQASRLLPALRAPFTAEVVLEREGELTEDQKKELKAVEDAVDKAILEEVAPVLAELADRAVLDRAIAFFESEEGRRAAALNAAATKFSLAMVRKVHRPDKDAVASLKTIVTAEEQYKATSGTAVYADLKTLSSTQPPYVDRDLGAGRKKGYSFTLVVATPADANWCALARPIVGSLGMKSFFVDSSGVIRAAKGRDATSLDLPIE